MSGQIALRSDGICDAAPVFVQVLTVAQRGSSVNKPLELVDRKWFDGSGIMVMRAGWLSRFCPLFLLLLLGKHSSVPQKTFIGVYEADDILCPQAGITGLTHVMAKVARMAAVGESLFPAEILVVGVL